MWNNNEVKLFYEQNRVEDWQQAIGTELHYHYGQLVNDQWQAPEIFQNAIRTLYAYIPSASSVIDCGCGWGGPAQLITEERKANVTAITNSAEQANYIKANFAKIRVVEADLHTVNLEDAFFDVAMFIESYTHLQNPGSVLTKIRNHTDRVVFRAYHSHTGYTIVDNQWRMRFPAKELLFDELRKSGFVLRDFTEVMDKCALPSAIAWKTGLQALSLKTKLSTHHQLLNVLSDNIINNTREFLKTFGLAIIYAEAK